MGAPYAEVSDVADIWPKYTAADEERVASLLEKASAKLRQACPFDIDARILLFNENPGDPKALDPMVVADVVAGIVRRALINPDGVVSESETAGPFSRSHSFASRNGQQPEVVGLQVTPADLNALRPAQSAAVASTIRVNAGRMAYGFTDGDPWRFR